MELQAQSLAKLDKLHFNKILTYGRWKSKKAASKEMLKRIQLHVSHTVQRIDLASLSLCVY
jgi:hypothetical protein